MTGRRLVASCVAVLALVPAAAALGAWSADGSGSAAGAATTMPTGGTPRAGASGNTVTVSWPAADLGNGTAVAGYVIERIDVASGVQAAAGGSCSGVVTALTCTDQPVPNGSWTYTDTPVQDSWTGGQSQSSNTVSTLG